MAAPTPGARRPPPISPYQNSHLPPASSPLKSSTSNGSFPRTKVSSPSSSFNLTPVTSSTSKSWKLLPPTPTTSPAGNLTTTTRKCCGIPQDNRPSPVMVLSFLSVFIVYAVLLSIGARHALRPVWLSLIVFGPLCFVCLSAWSIVYFLSNRPKTLKYRPNLGNTIAVVLITIPMFTVLYAILWYPKLRTDILVTSTDSAEKVRFPSIVLFQRKDWTSQANLISRHGGDSGSKCYLGWYNDSSPHCSEVDPETLGNSTTCQCRDLWYNNDQVLEDFVWMNTTYRYKAFDSPEWLLCNTPTYMLLLQTFFDYNATQAQIDSSTRLSPSLLLAVYDPLLGMQKAFDTGYTRMNLINANGIVAVNIGLTVRQLDPVIAYDYNLGLSSSPAMDLICDTSDPAKYYGACRLSLFITIPNFDRTIIKQ